MLVANNFQNKLGQYLSLELVQSIKANHLKEL